MNCHTRGAGVFGACTFGLEVMSSFCSTLFALSQLLHLSQCCRTPLKHAQVTMYGYAVDCKNIHSWFDGPLLTYHGRVCYTRTRATPRVILYDTTFKHVTKWEGSPYVPLTSDTGVDANKFAPLERCEGFSECWAWFQGWLWQVRHVVLLVLALCLLWRPDLLVPWRGLKLDAPSFSAYRKQKAIAKKLAQQAATKGSSGSSRPGDRTESPRISTFTGSPGRGSLPSPAITARHNRSNGSSQHSAPVNSSQQRSSSSLYLSFCRLLVARWRARWWFAVSSYLQLFVGVVRLLVGVLLMPVCTAVLRVVRRAD